MIRIQFMIGKESRPVVITVEHAEPEVAVELWGRTVKAINQPVEEEEPEPQVGGQLPPVPGFKPPMMN